MFSDTIGYFIEGKNQIMGKGLLYFVQNPLFKHLIRIDYTNDLKYEQHRLSSGNVPEDFEYLAIFECEDVEWVANEVF